MGGIRREKKKKRKEKNTELPHDPKAYIVFSRKQKGSCEIA
jgi:hypothetical protein